MQSLAGRVGPV